MEGTVTAPVVAEEKKGLWLNLGCGKSSVDGYLGVDCIKTDIADVVHDLETYPWPFAENSAEKVLLVHTLEHIGDHIGFFNELYRVMQPKGRVLVVGPYYQSSGCWQDPTHKRAFNEKLFLYFSKKARESQGMGADFYPITCDFEVDGDFHYKLEPGWKDKPPEQQAFAIKHYNNVVAEMLVRLKTVKEGPHAL